MPIVPPGLDGLGQSRSHPHDAIGTPSKSRATGTKDQADPAPALTSAAAAPIGSTSVPSTDKTIASSGAAPGERTEPVVKSAATTPAATPTTKSTTVTATADKVESPGKRPAASDTPTKGAAKGKKPPAPVQTPSTTTAPLSVDTNATSDAQSKRNHPGKIDLSSTVIKPDSIGAISHSATPSRVSTPSKLSITSRPTSPSEQDRKPAPRTLRVLATPTPRTETPPAVQTPGPAIPGPIHVSKIASRKQSVTSNVIPPGTPSSDLISDTVSLTSTSVSRANSPPPATAGASIIGSAPARLKTKSQQRKDRVERAKQLEDEKKQVIETASPVVEETVQEAIVGRKKKAKKPSAPPKIKATASAATTRPPSPVEPESAVSPAVNESAKSSVAPTPVEPTPVASPAEPGPPEEIIPAALMADLVDENGALLSGCFDILLKTHTQLATNYKPAQPIGNSDFGDHPPIRQSPDVLTLPTQLKALIRERKSIHFGGTNGRNWSRGAISPCGALLNCLEPALEDRFLDLEAALRAMPEELRFRPGEVKNGVSLPRVDVESVHRGMPIQDRPREPNAMEKAVEEGSKKGSFLVGHAEQYVNEFIMPVAKPSGASEGGASQAPGGTPTATPKKGRGGAMATTPEGLERMIADAKRVADEKEGQLRRLIKKNRKLMGLAH